METVGKVQAVTTESEFLNILGRFRNELANMEEQSGLILEKLESISPFKDPGLGVDKKEIEVRPGVLGELTSCINVFNTYNARLQEAKEHLTKLVG